MSRRGQRHTLCETRLCEHRGARARPLSRVALASCRVAAAIGLTTVLALAQGCTGRAIQGAHGVLVGERARAVSPGQAFGGEALRVHAPASPGWVLLRQTPAEISFARPGASSRETYVATVSLFECPATEGPDAFVTYIRQGRESDASPDRFADIRESYEYTEERGYPCVRYVATALDVKAPGGALSLAEAGVYCRHPRREGTGFWVSYSHRALNPDVDVVEQAKGFIQGVTVPDRQVGR